MFRKLPDETFCHVNEKYQDFILWALFSKAIEHILSFFPDLFGASRLQFQQIL